MWMDLLIVDVNVSDFFCSYQSFWVESMFLTLFQVTMMQATISASRLPQFRERLNAGAMFFVSGFDMCEKLLTHRFVFVDLTEPVSPLPEKAFRFHNQSELIGLANTNTLPGLLILGDMYLLYCWTSVCKYCDRFILIVK
ncbi:LOW QUALITY PROTEIN: hypothetical protein HID58_014307 [Brassica napus]|uniref:Uncharacterized protein n=1 Tax=Brassica napus TaxID=3708 RepID=A0ABQ8DGS4_BRANA|nr:LOW QUALITY PROTEIN: hypothetical protein HID58_014307 [Brassica napus]